MKNFAPSATDSFAPSSEAAPTAASEPISTHVANGRLAKGAKTPAGLARSAQNATKHGLTSKTFCLAHNEDAELFATHRDEFLDSMRPADAHEMQLVNQMIENAWLLCRARALAAAALRIEIEHQREHHRGSPCLTESDLSYLAVEALDGRNNTYANLIRYAATHERAYQRAARALEVSRKNKTVTAPPTGGYHCLDPDSFFKLPTSAPTPMPAPNETKPDETKPNETTPITDPLPPPTPSHPPTSRPRAKRSPLFNRPSVLRRLCPLRRE